MTETIDDAKPLRIPKDQCPRRITHGTGGRVLVNSPATAMTSASAFRVAILDDDQSIGSAISRLLRASNIEAEAYVSCFDLFDALAGGRSTSSSPNCLLLDLQMPDMSGLDVMRYFALRGIEIPTIVITAHDAAGTRERCIEAGAKGYLCKPLDGEELLLAIRNVSISGGEGMNSGPG